MKICLDSGHYKNYNQGAVKSYYEGNVMWEITKLQKKYLEEYKDVEVVLTRSNINDNPTLTTRGSKAKGCDLFISNHSNAINNESVDRAVIIYPYDNKNNSDVLGKKLGKVITEFMGLKQNYQMYQRTYNGGEYYSVMSSARRVGCPRYYIIEHGFHTNKATCNWLLNNSNLEKLAKAQVEVIANYYKLTKKETGFKQYIVRTTATSLNGREGAGTSYDITIKIPKGTAVTIVSEKTVSGTKWLRTKSGYWISSSHVEFVRYV